MKAQQEGRSRTGCGTRQDENGIAIQHEGPARALSGIAAGGEKKRGTATKRRPSAGDQAARTRKTR